MQKTFALRKFASTEIEGITKVFDKFCANYMKKEEYTYITEMDNPDISPSDPLIKKPQNKKRAVANFKKRFEEVIDSKVYKISSTNEKLIKFLGITMYSEKIFLSSATHWLEKSTV